MAEAPEALIQQAQSSLAVGDTATAQASLNQLLQLYPRHPQGLLRRGFVRIRLGDAEGAVEDWESAIEVDPSMLRQMDGADFRPIVEAALTQIKQLISQDPTNIRVQVLLGKAYAAFGRYAQALQAYTSALRIAPEEIEAGLGSAEVYMRLGQGEQALQVLQKLYELHPNNADLCARLGKLYNSLNSVVQATRFFERATSIEPNDWNSHLALGQIFMRQGRHEQATARFQKTLQIKSDCAPALVGLAECCKELYRFEAAISYYQQAVAVDPRDYKALCQMGSLCIQLGGLDMGIETLQQALELNDADVEIYSSLAKAYQQKGDLPTSARYFAKTVDLNPRDFFAAYNLGLIYRSQGQIGEAAGAFGRAADLRPNDSQYQYQSSRSLLELGRVEEALEAALKAVSLNPHSKESQLLYGRCCLESGRYDKAAEAFRQAVHIDAQNVEAHYQLAVALLHLGQTDDARNSFLTVLRLSPQHAPSQLGLGHVARRTGQWQTAADHYRQAIQLDLTLKPAIVELTKLYLERNQKEAINEFIRQLCVSRKGDHRIPAGFLQDWLDALQDAEQYDLAEEALDFILNVYPTSPQAKDNHRRFHVQAARHFLGMQQLDRTRRHLEQVQKMHPQDSTPHELQAELERLSNAPPPPPSPNPEPARDAFDSLDDPLWEPLDLEPKAKNQAPLGRLGTLAPPPLDDFMSEIGPTTQGLLPPPPLDDAFSHVKTSRPAASTLAPPPLDDFDISLAADFEPPVVQPGSGVLPPPPLDDLILEPGTWTALQIPKLAIEDVPAGLNPEESLGDLAQHYVDFSLHLESCGWLKQASLFLADARTLRPNDESLIEHQARVLSTWAARLQDQAEQDAATQIDAWLEGLHAGDARTPAVPAAVSSDLGDWGAAPPPVVAPVEEIAAPPLFTMDPGPTRPSGPSLRPNLPPPPLDELVDVETFAPVTAPTANVTAEATDSPWGSSDTPWNPPPLTEPVASAPAREDEKPREEANRTDEPAADWGAKIPDFESTRSPLAAADAGFRTAPWNPPSETSVDQVGADWGAVSASGEASGEKPPAPVRGPFERSYDPWESPSGPVAPPPAVSLIPPPVTPESVWGEPPNTEVEPEPAPSSEAAPEPFAERLVEPVVEPVAEAGGANSQTEIVEWMKSLQPPAPAAPAPPPPAPEPPSPPEPMVPYKSAEFEVHLTGQESGSELLQMIARNPDDPTVRSAVFRAYSDDVPGLLKVFRELCQEYPTEPYHVLNLARAYSHTGSDSLAVLQYRKYVKMEATSEGYTELGEIYERMGKAELAAQAKRRAQQLAEQEEAEDA